jgi:hypothetical protein
VYEFLATGHLWGRATFWEDVIRLGPADRLTVSGAGTTVEKYWEFDFDDQEGASTDALTDAIKRDIEQLPTGKAALTLSGGYDSRALLGFLAESDREFDVISYNFGDEYSEDFDADVAKAYASKAGEEIEIIDADWEPEGLIENIDYGIQVTGGESDVTLAQDAFLGREFFQGLAENYDYVLRGDEVWGFGDLAINRNTAFWHSLMFSVDQIPTADQILNKTTYTDGVEYVDEFRAEVDARLPETVSTSNELKDYVYWTHREGRLIQDVAAYRRQYLRQYAPFIFGRSFEVVNQATDSQRVNKQLFIESMREQFPALFDDDVEVTSKRPVASRFELLFEDEDFQSHVRESLLENPHPVVQDIVDMAGLEAWVDDVLSRSVDRNPTEKSQYNLLRRVYELSQRSNRLNAVLTYLYVDVFDQDFPIMDPNFLFRVYCLNRTLKEY